MSGRGNKKLSRKNDENRRWHIGVYGRRSFDDGENSESYTIKNQKALIESFLENKANIEIDTTSIEILINDFFIRLCIFNCYSMIIYRFSICKGKHYFSSTKEKR